MKTLWLVLLLSHYVAGTTLEALQPVFINRPGTETTSPGGRFVNVGFLFTLPETFDGRFGGGEAEMDRIYFHNLRRLVASLLPSVSPTHLLVMTRPDHVTLIANQLAALIGRHLALQVILKQGQKHCSEIKIQFVDLDNTILKHREQIDQMKPLFAPSQTILKPGDSKRTPDMNEGNRANEDIVAEFFTKYQDDIFFIAPFYHTMFPLLDHMIVLDVDIEFKSDLSDLYEHFSKFERTQMIGLANELSPYYLKNLKAYKSMHRRSPEGLPGFYQGFNTGVALYNLTRMRQSEIYTKELQFTNMEDLVKRYAVDGYVGDQEWLTQLSWKLPQLFHLLPCQFNQQKADFSAIYPGTWEAYHDCEEPSKIIHNNGEMDF